MRQDLSILAALILCAIAAVPVCGQEAAARAGLAPPFAAVRAAWNVPEEEALALAAEPGVTLEEFTILAVVGHGSHKPLQDLEALRRSGRTWFQLVKDLKGPLWDLIAHGSERYRLKAVDASKADAPEAEEEILRLAQVMTLERLTGRGPSAILRELDAGRDYAQLLSPNPASQNAPRKAERARPGTEDGWPPGLANPGAPPASTGFIDTGGSEHRH